jgi:vitamin B12 transporter
MTRINLLAGVCALAFVSTQALADTATVDEVVVTATRLPATVEQTAGARVIDRADIEQRGAVFLSDVLDTVPGISVYENGGFGGVASVRIRGASSDKTLVLVDGLPLNDPSQPSGGFDLSSFDLGAVDRIEILSGPQGSLWGSDAIGGVISVTTRETDGIEADAEIGSFNTRRGTVSFGKSEETWGLSFTASAFQTDGVSKAADGTEDDGLDSRTFSVRGRTQVGEHVRLSGSLRWSWSKADIDSALFPDPLPTDTPETYESDSKSAVVRAQIDGPLGFEHDLSVAAYHIDREGSGGFFPYQYDADRRLYRWVATRGKPSDQFSLAVGAEREEIEAKLSDGTTADGGANAAFAVVRVDPFERLSTTFSLRVDSPDDYDAKVTGRVSGVFKLGAGFALEGSWGQGFKTPTISQTVCDFCFPVGFSVGLKPEEAEGWDAGLRWRSEDDRFTARITGFVLDVTNQIDFYFDPNDFSFRYKNIAKTKSRGVELEGTAELGGGFSLSAAWSYTDATDESTGLQLLRVPERQGNIALAWTGERGRARVSVRGESDQADSPFKRDGFVVADFAGGWKLNQNIEATLRVENITDEDYQQVVGYGEPGRAAYVGLRLRY